MTINANEITAKIDITIITKVLLNKTLLESRTIIISANKLFKKWANIGTTILSVFKYKIDTQIAKINAEKIDPKLWSDAKNTEETNTENIKGINNFNLFRKTPLNINSSEIGATTTIVSKLLDNIE